jgi:hypothetical protein
VLPGAKPVRSSVDQVPALVPWKDTASPAPATDYLLKQFEGNPRKQASFENNEFLAERMRAKKERDAAAEDASEKVQNFRDILGQGGNWVDRLAKARADGVLPLPAIAGMAVPGLLGDQAQQAGEAFQEDRRQREMRRRAGLLTPGPVVYEDEERTF